MRSPSNHATVVRFLFLLPSLAAAVNIDCSDIRTDGKDFNLSPLDGPHSVWTIDDHPPTYTNTTFTVNVCRPLRKAKGVGKDEDCPNGSRVCAIDRLYTPGEDGGKTLVEKVVPIAGEFSTSSGGSLDPKFTRLKSSASTSDREKEGLRLELNGGSYKESGHTEKQKAIIEFLCKKDEAAEKKRDDEKDDEDNHDDEGKIQDDGQGGTLKWLSWDVEEDDIKVLRLEWDTKYACEDASADVGKSGGHWGFFTWLIIILFMGAAAYLIFGSWLNYNRYSARGWDVLPHSDTIQDLPYLFRDWMRRVINTVQGGGSRGGYSAV